VSLASLQFTIEVISSKLVIMFRTSYSRGRQRFLELRDAKLDKKGFVVLNKNQIKLIENTSLLSLGEKIELLLLSLGNKLTTELFTKIRYVNFESKKIEEPSKKDIAQLEEILKQLPFAYYKDSLPNKKNRLVGKHQNFTWFQVSINEATSEFMEKYPNELTEFEEGVLYGFPLSAIRAFSGLIKATSADLTPASYYLAGVCSKDFLKDEQEYYQKWWNKLRNLSPKIIKQAEKRFHEQNKTIESR